MMPLRDPKLPFPIASVVRFRNPESRKYGESYLVHKIVQGPRYSIRGHEYLNTKGMGSAWHDHREFELVSEPTSESWQWLWDLENEGED